MLALAGALLAGLAVWSWLPPSAESQEQLRRALVEYETATRIAWPTDEHPSTLTPRALEELAARQRAELARVAAGDALTTFDAEQAVEEALPAADEDFVVAWHGRIAEFDVRRRTLGGELLVRAAFEMGRDVAEWDAATETITGRQRVWGETAAVKEYRLLESAGGWQVVEVRLLPAQM